MPLDDVLCDNTLAHVVLFLDYESAVIFSQKISQALMHRMSCASLHIWRDIFERHFFSPPEQQEVDYLVECRDRKALLRNFVGKKKELHAVKQSLNLPNRFFSFVPVTPSDDDGTQIHDPPPVDFDCDSFRLTSGCEGEMIFLDPFDMSLVVHKNCVDNAVKSDETRGYMDAASLLKRRSNLGFHREISAEHISGAFIDESVNCNRKVGHYLTSPSQILMEAQDYFNVRLEEYFHFTNDRNARRQDENGRLLLHPDDEVEFGYMGIDSKTIVGQDGQVQGTWVGLGRFLCSLNVDVDHVCCTEIITWTRKKGQDLFGDMRICRVPGDFLCVDTCPKHQRTYVVFLRGQGPLRNSDPDDTPSGRRLIVAYPLLPVDDSTPPTSPRYFPNPEFTVRCSDNVSHVIVDCAGTLLVGTDSGNIEIWKPNAHSGMYRVTLLNVKESLIASARHFRAQTEGSPKNSYVGMKIHETNETEVNQGDDANMACRLPVVIDNLCDLEGEGCGEDSDVHMEREEAAAAENDEDWIPRLCGSATVESFHFSDHFPVELCGFVSVQHSRVEGTCLLLWKKPNPGSDFHVVSQIMLPLSPRRKPCVHYDGRRIVVCGQDHIGLIVLVYHVLSSMEDIEFFLLNPKKKTGDESGGIYNYTVQPHVRFAKRVRHAALGGLQYYDSMYMACNERFLIVNTKTGNLLDGGSSSTGEGLLIIDLKEHD